MAAEYDRAMAAAVRWAMAVVLALGVWLGEASRAEACSPPWGVSRRVVLPPDGATGVPLNAEVVVEYEGAVRDHEWPLQVRPVGGEPLALELDVFGVGWRAIATGRLDAQLEPDTTYEVLDRLTMPCQDSVANCLRDDFAVVATFTTGTAPDLVAPQFGGLQTLSSDFVPEDESDSCGVYAYVDFHLWWDAAEDDSPVAWLRYVVYDTNDQRWNVQLGGISAAGQALCSGRSDVWPLGADFTGPVGGYFVRAVDIAGNEDINRIAKRTDECPVAEPDAGPMADAAEPDAGSGADAEASSGCGCGAGGSGTGGGALLLSMIVLGCLRRRAR